MRRLGLGLGMIAGGAGGGLDPIPLNRFKYFIDFVNDVERGGFQTYGNNTNDGRFFRDPANFTLTYCPVNSDGSGGLIQVPAAGLRRTAGGHWSYLAGSNSVRQNRDLRITHQLTVSGGTGTYINGETVTSDSGGTGIYRSGNSTSSIISITGGSGSFAGSLTGITSGASKPITLATDMWVSNGITAARDAIGAEGAANGASSITAFIDNATLLQSFTQASNDHIFSADIKRLNGTGTLEMTLDGGTTWTVITGIDNTFRQKFITQSGFANPTFGFRIGTNGDSFAIDFATKQVASIAGLLIPSQYRVITVTIPINPTQSRAVADSADLGPLNVVPLAPYAVFWQGRSERPSGAGIITGITDTFLTGSTTGATFAQGGGSATSAAGSWKVGLDQVNKIAGFCTADGTIKMACNGSLASGAGVTFPATLDHWDFATNGAGSRSLSGVSEVFALSPNLTFTDVELIAMTS